jgi:predicted esterase
MTRRICTVLVCITGVSTVVTTSAKGDGPFHGEWQTTISLVKLEQAGGAVTGTFGANGQFSLKGNAKGNILTFEYEEGQAKGSGLFTLDTSGHAFTGRFQIRNGRAGNWNGWRPDPKASTGKTGYYTGLWLTDFGLMELTQDGAKLEGRYAARGTSSIKGMVAGRHLDFHFHNFRDGQGWFDFAADGKSFVGAGNSDGFPGWFGWKGQAAPGFQRHVPLAPDKIIDGSTKNLLTYSVRAPEGYEPSSSRKWPAVLILHGSNMNARSYVSTIASAWPDIARDFILLGINGETPSNISDDPRFNYSYVNYVGRSTFKGFPGTDRESPALVSEAMAELREVYPISHFLVGGHSQGGFLTYSLLMNFPESMAGAFPISAGVIFQCDPEVYADETLRKAQRAVPLAIVHGKNDPIMAFATGQYAASLFGEANWPAFRFFTDETAGHMFARLPVGQAIRWLESYTSDDPQTLIQFAANRLHEKAYRDAIAALRRVPTLKLNDSQKRRAKELTDSINAQTSASAAKYLPLIRQAKDGSWIDGFLAFRDDFEFADSAHEVMTAFAELRTRHKDLAQKAFSEARQAFQQGKQDEGYGKYREIVEKYYASPLYRNVKRWLEERK